MKRRTLSARALAAALLLGGLVTGVGLAQSAPNQGDNQVVPGIAMPSPMPQPTVSGTPIPYPAYGTPAPDVSQLTPKKGVPQSISLADAVRIGVALSPTFATQNAQWAAIHAKYAASVQAYYPGLSATAQTGKSYSNGTSASGSSSARPTSSPAINPAAA